MLLKLKEQIDMVASSEERSLLPDFSVVVTQSVLVELCSKLGEILSLFFFIEWTITLFCTTSDSGIGVFISLLPLILTFIMGFLIDDCLSSLELLLNVLFSGICSLHPRMGENFFEFGSVGRVDGHHLLEEVLELGGVDVFTFLGIFVRLPKDLGTIGSQKAVVWVLWICTAERRPLGQNDEEDDGRSEKVNAWTRVRFSQVDLRSHVRSSSELRLEHSRTVASLSWCGESKVSNLQIEVAVKHQVFWLEITVSEASGVQVAEALHQLLEVVSGVLLLQLATKGNEVEEFATTNEFKHDVLDLLACVLLGVGLHSFTNFDHVDDVGMFDFRQSVYLCFDELLELLVLMEDLDSVASSGVILGKFNFATNTAAERSTENIVS